MGKRRSTFTVALVIATNFRQPRRRGCPSRSSTARGYIPSEELLMKYRSFTWPTSTLVT